MAFTRRAWLAAAAFCALPQVPAIAATPPDFSAIERNYGGRLGVAAFDIATGRRLTYRAAERFPMCSTHKVLSVAAVLTRVDHDQLALHRRISYGTTDLLSYAPVTRKNVLEGGMTLDALCAAALDWSDNTAANLLLDQIGGPPGWTRYARSIGDHVSRLDRTEPTLNAGAPGDPRDTTTPDAMLRDLNMVLLGQALSTTSRKQLLDWMLASSITAPLIKAGVPKTWRVADKSGSGNNGTRNDIGVLLPPGKPAILATIYYTESKLSTAEQNRVIATAANVIAMRFGS